MEQEIFKSKLADKRRLSEYGFTEEGGTYSISLPLDSENMVLTVNICDSQVSTSVTDSAFGEEYVLYKVAEASGNYVGKIREEIRACLLDICEKCFYTKAFTENSTRVVFEHCKKKYGCVPEYLFEGSPDCAVFRRADTKKWFAVVMKIKRDRLGLSGEGTCEIVNLHARADTVPSLIDKTAIFPAYHMNKKHWISVLLEGGITDDFLRSLIDVSYSLGKK